ncbi:hypothetical protein [Stenotrophomonas sp. SAU14A_NAIMI4_5]|uniref:hypothetical protein n=1 Tax=Stenotrophomonas sp. SAU14A_NAIMI4_5 TaxID=2072413 RepID=UPI00131F1FA3|nr:hypothetical protein [Stenotrophomonas sp. SAU14A_NAIMI4_5]
MESSIQKARFWSSPVAVGLYGLAAGCLFTGAFFWTPQTRAADAAAWASAIATSVAVIVALYVSKRQIDVAKDAAQSERTTALELQQAAQSDLVNAHRRRAMRLAHAFSRELVLARRDLMVFLVNIRPPVMANPSRFMLEVFFSEKPLPDLALIARFADQLDGFEDEHAFAILTLLAGWQSFNRWPGMNAEAFISLEEERRWKMADNRSEAGHEILLALGRVVNLLAPYYENHASMLGFVMEEVPDELAQYFPKAR